MVSFPSLTSTAVIALIPPVVPSIHSVFSQLLNLSLRYVFTANPACEYHAFELLYVFVRSWFGSSMVPCCCSPLGPASIEDVSEDMLVAGMLSATLCGRFGIKPLNPLLLAHDVDPDLQIHLPTLLLAHCR